jgi:hypothetical protein
MEKRYCSTGQSPQRTLAPAEEEVFSPALGPGNAFLLDNPEKAPLEKYQLATYRLEFLKQK